MLDDDAIKAGSQSYVCARAVLFRGWRQQRQYFSTLYVHILIVLSSECWGWQVGPSQIYLGLEAFLSITFHLFHLLHVEHLCLWSWQTPEQRQKNPLKNQVPAGILTCSRYAVIICAVHDRMSLTWRTDKQGPLSEWPLPGFAHPGSSPVKNDTNAKDELKKAKVRLKPERLTIGKRTNFWRKSWESYRLKSPKSAMYEKRFKG